MEKCESFFTSSLHFIYNLIRLMAYGFVDSWFSFVTKFGDILDDLLECTSSTLIVCQHLFSAKIIATIKNSVLNVVKSYVLGTWCHLRYFQGSVLVHLFIWLLIPTWILRLITLWYLGNPEIHMFTQFSNLYFLTIESL
jgi:hypothetical protein